MEQSINIIVHKISEIKEQVPSDWADVIAIKMGKEPVTIRAYARGTRGTRRGYPLQVLEHLQEYFKEHSLKVKQLTT